MKRICQMTFTTGNNAGAWLQTFALNKTLTSFGCNVDVLNFSSGVLKAPRETLKKRILLPFFIFKRRYIVKKRWLEFNQFFKNQLRFVFVPNESDLKNLDYDLFLVGSDQVWNKMITKRDFLLTFVDDNAKKVSYACSLGDYSISLKNNEIIDELNKFNKVSFREEIDYNDAIRNGLNKADVHIDPTFLINKEEWIKLSAGSSKIKTRDFVLIFCCDKNLLKIARGIAKKENKKIVVANYFGLNPLFGIKIINFSSPLELVDLIQRSSIVLTTSFHGYALSLNLNKKVLISSNPNFKKYQRFAQLQKELGVCESNIDLMKTEYDCLDFDWDGINANIKKQKEKSLAYLRSLIDEKDK